MGCINSPFIYGGVIMELLSNIDEDYDLISGDVVFMVLTKLKKDLIEIGVEF